MICSPTFASNLHISRTSRIPARNVTHDEAAGSTCLDNTLSTARARQVRYAAEEDQDLGGIMLRRPGPHQLYCRWRGASASPEFQVEARWPIAVT